MRPTLQMHKGFTLVEVLCVTFVGGAVVALGGLVAVQCALTSRIAGKELRHRWLEARIVDQFRNDVVSAIHLPNEGASAFSFPGEEGQLLEIVGLATVPANGSLYAQRLPSRIRYTTETSTRDERSLRLIREVTLLIEGDEPGTFREVLGEGLRTASVSQFMERKWIEGRTQINSVHKSPEGLRLNLQWHPPNRPATECTALVYRDENILRGKWVIMQNRHHTRSFTLVLTLFLTVMIVVSGGALALTGSVESLAALQHAAHFHHELAVGNFVACFPRLIKKASETSGKHDKAIRLELSYDACTIRCVVNSERAKFNLGTRIDPTAIATHLRDLARRNDLPEANVRVRPSAHELASEIGSRVFWFSQVIQPTQLEEVFHWSFPDPAEDEAPRRKTWSDIITFWKGHGSEVFSLELETHIQGSASRRWYVVVSMTNQSAEVLYQGPCS